MDKAREAGIDLVEVAPTSSPPVCRLMDYGKWKYDQKKKEHKSKVKQHNVVLKEVRLRPKIEQHDRDFKLKRAKQFLEKTFLGRDKFSHFRLWSERYFSEYITESILKGSKDLKEFIDPKRVEIVVREHMAGRRNYLEEIDKLLTLATTNKMLLSGNLYQD